MRPYELMTILAPDVPEDALPGAIENVASHITANGGTVIAVNYDSPWGRRRLAYPIRYQSRDVRDGFYILWYFDAEPEAIAEIDRDIRLNDQIIRHLTIALDKPFVPAEPEAPEEAAPAEGEATDEAPQAEEDTAETPAEAAVEPAAEAPAESSDSDEEPAAEPAE